ncbi:MAG: glycosyl hydrolase-related protein, partial [Desulfurococcus sp.]|nr:glycosyl hydrolase-related protein [Desulfurococcus sp.]
IARIGWLPDSFGFSAQLPQLLRKAGLEVFVTHKLMWNDTNKFPHTLFQWEGLDGTRIPVHIISVTYNGEATVEEILRVWENHIEKNYGAAIHTVGYGNGGGGPNVFIAERLLWINKLPSTPRVKYNLADEDYVKYVKELSQKLPVWKGEMYVETHRGTYTTNHKIKELVSRLERCLRTTEIWATISWIENHARYPRESLSEIWEKLLRSQFHDVLPGSANFEAYQEAYKDLEEALQKCEETLRRTLYTFSGPEDPSGKYIYVFNSLPWTRREVITLPRGTYVSKNLKVAGAQSIGENTVIEIEVPGIGYGVLEKTSSEPAVQEGPVKVQREPGRIILSNEFIDVFVYSDGSISLVSRELKWEAIGRGSLQLKAHQDKPGLFDAWDIEKSSLEDPGVPLRPLGEPRVVLEGPLIACVEIPLGFKNSKVNMNVCLKGSSKLLEVKMNVNWNTRGYLLKLWMKPSINSDKIQCEIPFGVLERALKPQSKWDEAKYEFPVLRWIDISDGSKGLAVISTIKHGYSPREDWIGLTIAKSPLFPDPYSNLEPFNVEVYLYAHEGDYRKGEVYRRAYEVWDKLEVKASHKPPSEYVKTYVSVESGSALIEALKKAESGESLIMRIYDATGTANETEIKLWKAFSISEADLLEEPLSSQEYSGGKLRLHLKGFEVKTLRLTPS